MRDRPTWDEVRRLGEREQVALWLEFRRRPYDEGRYQAACERVEAALAVLEGLDVETWLANRGIEIIDSTEPATFGTAKIFGCMDLDRSRLTVYREDARAAIVAHEAFHVIDPHCPATIAEMAAHLFAGRVTPLQCFAGMLDLIGEPSQKGIGGRDWKNARWGIVDADWYRDFFDNAPLGMFRTTATGRLAAVNQSLARILGYPGVPEMLQDAPDVGWCRFADPDAGPALDRLLQQDGSASIRTGVRRADGTIAWVAIHARRVSEASEGIVEDVTERQHQEKDLKDSQRFLGSIVENIPDMIFIKDAAKLGFVLFNRAGEELLGYHREDLIGKSDYDFFPPDEADFFTAKDRAVLNGGTLLDIPEEPIHTTRGLRFLHTKKIPLLDPQGQPQFLLGISEDITERKQADETLRRAIEAAEAANRAKSAFLANMSHEIRTPMNAVIGLTDLVLASDLSSEQREYLDMVKSSGTALLALLDDILDFSKIEAGHLELQKADFFLRQTVSDALGSLAVSADKKGLELIVDVRPEVPDALVGDPWRLRQLLVNLVGNAIKFTDRGEVMVRFEVDPAVGAGPTVGLHLVVSDTGIGVSPDKRTVIFQPFAQADVSSTRRFGGTGLGLAISSRLAEMMGGRLWIQEEPEPDRDRGATFNATLRYGRQSVDAAAPVRLKGLTVLAVEDNESAGRFLAEMLASCEVQPTLVRDAGTALSAWRQAQVSGTPFGAILIDADLAGKDGYDLARHFKLDLKVAVPIVMILTSLNLRRYRKAHAEIGLSGYVVKPILGVDLLRVLESATTGRTTDPVASPLVVGYGIPAFAPQRVLVVEDNRVNQMVVKRLLETWGCTVQVADNGIETLRLLERENFDLILLDMQMPEMDGFETARAIRDREASNGAHVHIIAVTAHAMRGDRERCLEAGSDQYIAKPIQMAELHEAIRKAVTPPSLERNG